MFSNQRPKDMAMYFMEQSNNLNVNVVESLAILGFMINSLVAGLQYMYIPETASDEDFVLKQ